MSKIVLLILLFVTVILFESGCMVQVDQPIPQPAPIPPQPTPLPIHPPTNFIQMQILQSKETVPHQKETSLRLYIRLKPHIIHPVRTPPAVVCTSYKEEPKYTWWDWFIINHFPLFGTWYLFDFLEWRLNDQPKYNCITPTPAQPNYFQNVKIRIELQHPQSRGRIVSYLRGIPIIKSNVKQEIDANGKNILVIHVENALTTETHIVVELFVPASEVNIQQIALVSLFYKGMSESNGMSETVVLRRGSSLMDSKLPLEIIYQQYPSAVASSQQEQFVHIEIQLKRLADDKSINNDRIQGIEFIFEKHTSHSISSAFLPMKLNGSTVIVNLNPWIKEQMKTMIFDIKMPPALKAGTQILMRNPKILYHFRDSTFKYPMEIEFLERSIFRQ